MDALAEFESMREEARAQWIQRLPTLGLWGVNPVPRGEIRGSYRIIPECPTDRPIMHGILGSFQAGEGTAVIEDLRRRDRRGVPERIFTKGE